MPPSVVRDIKIAMVCMNEIFTLWTYWQMPEKSVNDNQRNAYGCRGK